jgi:hypothetical protein
LFWTAVVCSTLLRLVPRPHLPNQSRFARRLLRHLRDDPSVRTHLGLPVSATGPNGGQLAPALRPVHRFRDCVFDASLVGSRTRGRLPGSKWSHLFVGPEQLRQEIVVRTPASGNTNTISSNSNSVSRSISGANKANPAGAAAAVWGSEGIVLVEADKAVITALGGRLHWGRWSVKRITIKNDAGNLLILQRKPGQPVFEG